jgi:hypothetical protein
MANSTLVPNAFPAVGFPFRMIAAIPDTSCVSSGINFRVHLTTQGLDWVTYTANLFLYFVTGKKLTNDLQMK